MKNNFISMLAVALGAAALFTSCEKEQSVFSPESLPGTCTITGVVNYNEGYALLEDGGVISEHITPAAGQVVLLKIKNDEYGSGTGEGYQIYTDTLDAEGRYEFTVPAPANGTEIDGTIEVIPFKASYGEWINNQLVITDSVLYNLNSSTNVTIRDKFLEQAYQITVNKQYEDNDIEFTTKVTVEGGAISAPGFVYDNINDSYEPRYIFTGTQVIIEVSFCDSYNSKWYTIYYTTESDPETGEYSADIYLPDDFFSNYHRYVYSWTDNNNTTYTDYPSVSTRTIKEAKDFNFYYQDNGQWKNETLNLLYKESWNTSDIHEENEYIPVEVPMFNIETQPLGPENNHIRDNMTAVNIFGWNFYIN